MPRIDVELTSTEYDLFLLLLGGGGGMISANFPQWLDLAATVTNKLLANQENFIPVEVRDGLLQQIRTKQ